MSDKTQAEVFPVGCFIFDEAKERGWSVQDLAHRMGGETTELDLNLLIYAPTKGVTLDEQTAAQLASVFGTSKGLWMRLDETWQRS